MLDRDAAMAPREGWGEPATRIIMYRVAVQRFSRLPSFSPSLPFLALARSPFPGHLFLS